MGYKGKYVVLFFYPLDFTFVCPTEIIAFNDRAGEFESNNCAVIACSTDSHFSHLAWCQRSRKEGGLGDMQIPLLADKNMAISRAYGVLKEDEGLTFRGLFIIDPEGKLRQITINDLLWEETLMRPSDSFKLSNLQINMERCAQLDGSQANQPLSLTLKRARLTSTRQTETKSTANWM